MEIIAKNNSEFPHSSNILEIVNSLNLPIPSNAIVYLSGGFALALLYAQRKENMLISNEYYSDIDLYFHRLADYRATLNSFSADSNYKLVADTSKATTYVNASTGLQVQLIKFVFGYPIQIAETYDIVNCAAFYRLDNKQWQILESTASLMSDRSLDLYHTPLLDNTDCKDYASQVYQQLERITKYMKRYSLSLSNNAAIKLLKIYNAYPDLVIEKDSIVYYRVHYQSFQKTVSSRTEVWSKFDLFSNHEAYDFIKSKYPIFDKKILSVPDQSDNLEAPF